MQRESALDKLRTQYYTVTITREILESGKSVNNGWNRGQLIALGESDFIKGWYRRLIGKQVSQDAVDKFLSLKDDHITGGTKVKRRKKIYFEPVLEIIDFKNQYKHPNWQKMRLHVLKRDGFACVNCGDKEINLHAHHLKYLKGKFIWEVPIWYLVTLCENCHSEEHNRDLRMK